MNNNQKRKNIMNALTKLAEAKEILKEVDKETEENLTHQIEQIDENRCPSVANYLVGILQEIEERD